MKKISLLILAALTVFFIGCEADDKVVDQVIDGTGTGAALRTINREGLSYNATDVTSAFSVTMELQDASEGDLLESLDIFLTFTDNFDDGTDNSKAETLVTNVPASAFTTSSRGLPEVTFDHTLADALALLGLVSGEFTGGDQFSYRMAINFTDGTTWSSGDVNSNVAGGSYFSSPFVYNLGVVCILDEVPAGTWRIDMQDSYNDGWQTTTSGGGPGITITLSTGTVIEVGLCSPYGSAAGTFLGGPDCTPGTGSGTATFDIPAGVASADWNFPGDFWGEISFQVYAPSGNLVADVAAGSPAGEVVLNLCQE